MCRYQDITTTSGNKEGGKEKSTDDTKVLEIYEWQFVQIIKSRFMSYARGTGVEIRYTVFKSHLGSTIWDITSFELNIMIFRCNGKSKYSIELMTNTGT